MDPRRTWATRRVVLLVVGGGRTARGSRVGSTQRHQEKARARKVHLSNSASFIFSYRSHHRKVGKVSRGSFI